MGFVVFKLEEPITPDPGGHPVCDPTYAKYPEQGNPQRPECRVLSRLRGKGVQEGCKWV